MNMMNFDPLVKVHSDAMIYDVGRRRDAYDFAIQIRHLACVGIAAQESGRNIRHLPDALSSLLEVIAQLAHQVECEIEEGKEATI